MRDMRFPKFDRSELDKVFREIKVGDRLAHMGYSRWERSYRMEIFEVKRVTPRGSIRMDNEDLIKDMWGSSYYPITDELITFAKSEDLGRELSNLLFEADRESSKILGNITMSEAGDLIELLKRLLNKEER